MKTSSLAKDVPAAFPHAAKPAIAYERTGSGPALVFVHGLTYDRRMWRPVIERLKGSFTCVAIDLPGHGESADAASYDLEVGVAALCELIVKLRLERPLMVGHSAGAILVAVYASRYPVAGVVTSDQTLYTTPFISKLQSMRAQLHSPACLPIWRSIESSLGIELIPEPHRQLVIDGSNPRPEVILGYWREIFMTTPEAMEQRFSGFLRQITAPFAAVFGEDVSREYQAWVRALLPQYAITLFPDAGHFPHLVEPEMFANVVRAAAGRA